MPVSADLENCFADEPEGVAETITLAVGVGLSGGSVEDYTGDRVDPIYPIDLAVARVAAAVEAAHATSASSLTARAENHIRGRDDLDDTITRLQRYREAGADVVYAPGVSDPADIGRLVESVDAPVNVLALPGCTVGGAAGRARCRPGVGRQRVRDRRAERRGRRRRASCATTAPTASGTGGGERRRDQGRVHAVASPLRQGFEAARRRAGSSAAT